METYRFKIVFLLLSLWLTFPSFSLKVAGKDFVVVIDPGHGGHDPGAIGQRGKEKNINLNVALKLGRQIQNNCNDVKVIYTRKTDVFIPLDRRAQIANNAKADLFISIHTNSVAKGKTVKGAETYTLGLHRTEENLEVAKKENSVILIEDNYEQRYAGFNPNSAESYIIFEFLQDKNMEKSVKLATHIQKHFRHTARRIDKGVHQAGFLVLRATSMPGVLVELGYISNPEEERYLLSDSGTTTLANSIYKAFLEYKREHGATNGNTPAKASAETDTLQETLPEPEEEKPIQPATAPQKKVSTENSRTDKPVFKVQILTSGKVLPKGSKLLKGVTPVGYYQEKGIYKYTYGETTDYNKIVRMRREILPKFKDAFIIAFKNGEKMDVNEAIKEFKKNR
ncbi:MAG: N-acetylmuramoyl-L-alanine amidase [Bacteroidales bacterium]|nr:N-acetylmuramoyl-L-alanine amidase [Bacteroidales bacterium]